MAFNLTAADYEEPEENSGSMSAFSQIGPPRNLSVQEHPRGGFLVRWEEPDYGQGIGLYIIR